MEKVIQAEAGSKVQHLHPLHSTLLSFIQLISNTQTTWSPILAAIDRHSICIRTTHQENLIP
jgi:hypothetical protein